MPNVTKRGGKKHAKKVRRGELSAPLTSLANSTQPLNFIGSLGEKPRQKGEKRSIRRVDLFSEFDLLRGVNSVLNSENIYKCIFKKKRGSSHIVHLWVLEFFHSRTYFYILSRDLAFVRLLA